MPSGLFGQSSTAAGSVAPTGPPVPGFRVPCTGSPGQWQAGRSRAGGSPGQGRSAWRSHALCAVLGHGPGPTGAAKDGPGSPQKQGLLVQRVGRLPGRPPILLLQRSSPFCRVPLQANVKWNGPSKKVRATSLGSRPLWVSALVFQVRRSGSTRS